MAVKSVKELTVYQKSYEVAMRVFGVSKRFPKEEVFALTGQIRRSSRSVCQNLREAWAKRRYPAHFVSKLTDCDGESGETETSLDFARVCAYISVDEHNELVGLCSEVGKMLGSMIQKPEPFLLAEAEPGIRRQEAGDRRQGSGGRRQTAAPTPDPCPLSPDSRPLTPDP